MEDDGPKAMKNFRSTQKIPTDADKFIQEHHEPYELRGRQSSHQASKVRLHNATYPKLHDEVENKRTLSKPARPTNRKHAAELKRRSSDNICCVCLQRRKQERRKRTYNRRKSLDRTSSNKNDSAKYDPRRNRTEKALKDRSGINKSKKRKRMPYAREVLLTELRSISSGVRSSDAIAAPKTSRHYVLIHEKTSNQDVSPRTSETLYSGDIKKERYASEDMILQSPSSSAPSMSSYNSYQSMDHEPMVDDKNI